MAWYGSKPVRRDPYGLLAFGVGDRVCETEGCHVGTVIAVFSSRLARVRWNDSRWISDLPMEDLRAADDN